MPFLKGHRPSEETRSKISVSLKRAWARDYERLRATRARGLKASQAQRGRRLSEETKARISKANTGKPSPKRGVPLSEEQKAKISKTLKGRASPKKGIKLSPGLCAKMSVAQARSILEGRRKGDARRGIRTEYKGIMFRSKAEARYAAVLDAIGIEWQHEPCALPYQDAKGGLHHYIPDFWLPDLGVYLEIGFPDPKKLTKLDAVDVANPEACVQLVTLNEVAVAYRRLEPRPSTLHHPLSSINPRDLSPSACSAGSVTPLDVR